MADLWDQLWSFELGSVMTVVESCRFVKLLLSVWTVVMLLLVVANGRFQLY